MARHIAFARVNLLVYLFRVQYDFQQFSDVTSDNFSLSQISANGMMSELLFFSSLRLGTCVIFFTSCGFPPFCLFWYKLILDFVMCWYGMVLPSLSFSSNPNTTPQLLHTISLSSTVVISFGLLFWHRHGSCNDDCNLSVLFIVWFVLMFCLCESVMQQNMATIAYNHPSYFCYKYYYLFLVFFKKTKEVFYWMSSLFITLMQNMSSSYSLEITFCPIISKAFVYVLHSSSDQFHPRLCLEIITPAGCLPCDLFVPSILIACSNRWASDPLKVPSSRNPWTMQGPDGFYQGRQGHHRCSRGDG